MTKALTRDRFNLFAIGTRSPVALLMADELSYWSDLDETIIGTVFRDTTDDDFGWILMARDRLGRFRSIEVEASLAKEGAPKRDFVSGLPKSVDLRT